MHATETISEPPVREDPWQTVYQPAARGQSEAAFAAMNRLEAVTPLELRSRLYAISARALWALGFADLAARALARALTLGGADAAALATLVRPDGRHWGRARLQIGSPGQQADAACDLAWLALREGDVDGAIGAIDDALARCPHHAEAGRWARLLADRPERAATLASSANAGDDDDAAELFPREGLGWLSTERAVRRVEAGAWYETPPNRTALAALVDAGVLTRLFAMDADYLALGEQHPLVGCEAAVDRVLSTEREGLPTGDAARDLWQAAARVDGHAIRDAAGMLAALGVRDRTAAGVGLLGAETLHQAAPGEPLWRAYRARLLADVGPLRSAIDAAREVLADPLIDHLSWVLCVDALRRAGAHREALRVAQRSVRVPTLAALASRTLSEWDAPRAVLPMVSDRLERRFPGLG